MVWFPVTASSQITWETTWLIGDLTGIMHGAEPQARWVWLWWGYGAADTSYLTSDAGLYGMETVAVIGGLTLFTAWFYLLKAELTGDKQWPTEIDGGAGDLGMILVTGGSGFVGQHPISELLVRGHHVRSLDFTPSIDADPRLEVVVGDVCDAHVLADVVDGIDTVFHTAAVIGLLSGGAVTSQYRQRSFAVNVEATRALINHAREAGVGRLVCTSRTAWSWATSRSTTVTKHALHHPFR